MMKSDKIILTLFMMLVLSITINVVLHEGAHYFVAESLGLNPSVRITGFSEYKQSGFLSPGLAIAAIEYTSVSRAKDAFVAIAGPLANFALAGVGLVSLKKKNAALLTFITISFLSGALNLMPFWHSDGLQVFDYLASYIGSI